MGDAVEKINKYTGSKGLNTTEKLKKKVALKVGGIAFSILGPFVAFLGGLMFFILVIGGPETFMPNMEPEMVSDFQSTATYCGIKWEEILAYVTVKQENDFTDLNIDEIVADFLLLTYSKYHEETKISKVKMSEKQAIKRGFKYDSVDEFGMVTVKKKEKSWVLDGTYHLQDAREIYEFANQTGNVSSGIKDVVDHIRKLDKTEEYDISLSSKEVRDFVEDLTEEQQQWYDVLVAENLIKISMGTYVELPEDIIVQTSGFFAWPVPGKTRLTSMYGERIDPVYGTRSFHRGTDIGGVGIGTPVGASASGIVVDVQYKTTGYGYNVVLEHVDEEGHVWRTRYAHLSQIAVSKGEEIQRGHVIGATGSSGKSTGPHLHFEILYEGTNVDPLLLVTPN